jgi:hypothetical protein
MAKTVNEDHPPAYAYDDRTIKAVKSVLLEIGQILGSYHSKFVVVGGAVPWLLLDNPQMRHIGSLDVDLSLDPVALGDGEYAQLVDELRKNGYARNEEPKKKFQMIRTIEANDAGPPIQIVVDFLMPRDAKYEKNVPPLVEGFAVQRADGARLALLFSQDLPIEGEMPKGGKNRIELKVASIPALLAMKGFALRGRLKDKDSYDIYYCVRNYPGGIDALIADCAPLLDDPEALTAYKIIAEKFLGRDYHGPKSVARFAAEGQILEDRDEDQWQTDAFGQVNAWLKGLGLA